MGGYFDHFLGDVHLAHVIATDFGNDDWDIHIWTTPSQ
jgi:hypothetical protein